MKRLLTTFFLTTIMASQSWGQFNISVIANPFVDPEYVQGESTSGFVDFIVTNNSTGGEDIRFLQLDFKKGERPKNPTATLNGVALPAFKIHRGHQIIGPDGDYDLVISPGSSMILRVNYNAGKTPVKSWEKSYILGVATDIGIIRGRATLGSPPVLTPEPGTFVLLSIGMAGIGVLGATRKRKQQV